MTPPFSNIVSIPIILNFIASLFFNFNVPHKNFTLLKVSTLYNNLTWHDNHFEKL